jgi:hypothetical protein
MKPSVIWATMCGPLMPLLSLGVYCHPPLGWSTEAGVGSTEPGTPLQSALEGKASS